MVIADKGSLKEYRVIATDKLVHYALPDSLNKLRHGVQSTLPVNTELYSVVLCCTALY